MLARVHETFDVGVLDALIEKQASFGGPVALKNK